MKKKSVLLRLGVLFAICLLFTVTGCQKKEAPTVKKSTSQVVEVQWPFYQIRKDNAIKGYVLGSIHIGDKDWYPFPKEIKTALKRSDVLITEIMMKDMVIANPSLMEKYYETDTPITTNMTEETKIEFEKRCDEYGISKEEAEKMTLFALYQTAFQKSVDPAAPLFGIDIQIFKESLKYSVENEGLETVEEQFEILSTMMNGMDVNQLDTWFVSKKENTLAQETLVSQYLKGEVENVHDTLYETAGEAELEDLSYQRNIQWIPQLKTFLEDKTIFLTVGALHLYGDKGVLQLLEDEGYTLTKIDIQY